MKLKNTQIITFFSLLIFFNTSTAQFWDQGLVQGKAKTEYEVGKGTINNGMQITFDASFEGAENCKFDADSSFSGCPARANITASPPVWLGALQQKPYCNGSSNLIGDSWEGCIFYDESPFFSINEPINNHYWVIGANDDPSFDQCKEGPPNLSHQVYKYSTQDTGLFKVDARTVADSNLNFKKIIKMGIHSSEHDFYCDINQDYELGTIPFLSFGAQKEKGNQIAVGSLASRNYGGLGRLEFKAEVIDFTPFSCPPNDFGCPNPTPPNLHVGSHAGIFVIASWNDTHHMLFLELLRTGIHLTTPRPGMSFWNWPIEDSFYYPGAKIATFAADQTLAEACHFSIPSYDVNAIEPQEFDIDISRLYECARDLGYYPDLPDTGVEIEGVHWFIETNGPKGELSIEIQDIFMNQDDLIYRDPF